MSRFFALAFCLLFSVMAFGQAATTVKRFNLSFPGNDVLIAGLADASHNLFTVQVSGNFVFVTKRDPKMGLIWESRFVTGSGAAYQPSAATLDGNGDLIIVGYYQTSAGVFSHLEKISSSTGVRVWEATQPGSTTYYQVACDSANNIYAEPMNYGVMKFNTGGQAVWTASLPLTPNRMIADAKGDTIFAGTDGTAYSALQAAKLDPTGKQLWKYSLGASFEVDYLNDVCLDPTGNVLATGALETHTPQGQAIEGYTVKLNGTSGAIIWQSTQQNGSDLWDYGSHIACDATSGDAFVAGGYVGYQTVFFYGDLYRLDAKTGVRKAFYSFGDSVHDFGPSNLASDGAGSLYMVSTSTVRNDNATYETDLRKFDLSCKQQWMTVLATKGAMSATVCLAPDTADKRVNVLTSNYTNSYYLFDLWLEALDPVTGGVLKQMTLDTLVSGDEYAISAVPMADGGWAILGSEIAPQGDFPLVVRYNADGTLRWSTTLPQYTQGSPPWNPLFKVSTAADGSVYVGGSFNYASDNDAMLLVKLDEATGKQDWVYLYTGDQLDNRLSDFMIDAGGNILIAGSSQSSNEERDLVLTKLNPATGMAYWTTRTGNSSSDFWQGTLAISPSGSIVVGCENGTFGHPVVAQFNSSGQLTWTYTNTSNVNNPGSFSNVVALPNNDVIVGGFSDAPLIVRLNGSTGTPVWTVKGGASSFGVNFMALTPAGNLVIRTDNALEAFDVAKGASLWQNLTAFSNYMPYQYENGMAISPNGNIVAVGWLDNGSGTPQTSYVAEFSGETGARRWQWTHPDPMAILGVPMSVWVGANNLPVTVGSNFNLEDGSNGDIVTAFWSVPTTTRSFQLSVSVGTYLGNLTTVPFDVQIRAPGSTTAIWEGSVMPDKTGLLKFSAKLPDGQYVVAVKGTHWLRSVTPSITVVDSSTVTGLALTLINGDVLGHNKVDSSDVAAVNAALGSKAGSSNWNANADLNGDGVVDSKDLAIVNANVGKVGAP